MKKLGLYIGCLLGIILFLPGCASFNEELTPAHITIEELELRRQQSMDPHKRFATAKTFLQNQEVSTSLGYLEPNLVQQVEVRFKLPGSFKLTTYDENQPVSSFIFDQERGWSVDYRKRRIRELNAKELDRVRLLTTLTRPDSKLKDIFSEIKIQNCRIGDEMFYKITCRRTGGVAVHIYVDQQEYLTRRWAWRAPQISYDSSIESYSLYEGIRIPCETRATTNGLTSTTRVTDYQLNVPIAEDEFKPPIF